MTLINALINATLSAEALAYIVGCSFKEEWETLEKHHSSSTRLNMVNLKTNLQSITKKADEPVDSYIKRIKEIKDKLVTVSSVVNDEDCLIYALSGLPYRIRHFSYIYAYSFSSVTFVELHVLLKAEESAHEKQSKQEDLVVQPTVMYASPTNQFCPNQSSVPPSFFGGCGRGRNSGHGQSKPIRSWK